MLKKMKGFRLANSDLSPQVCTLEQREGILCSSTFTTKLINNLLINVEYDKYPPINFKTTIKISCSVEIIKSFYYTSLIFID